jgi:hypothetical protein
VRFVLLWLACIPIAFALSGLIVFRSDVRRFLAWLLNVPFLPVPLRALLFCPRCRGQHVDRGAWATKLHRTHRCEHCGHEWIASSVRTVGVEAL